MSLKQRRDHKAEPMTQVQGQPCAVCGEPIRTVYDRTLKVHSRLYWRHVRRAA